MWDIGPFYGINQQVLNYVKNMSRGEKGCVKNKPTPPQYLHELYKEMLSRPTRKVNMKLIYLTSQVPNITKETFDVSRAQKHHD